MNKTLVFALALFLVPVALAAGERSFDPACNLEPTPQNMTGWYESFDGIEQMSSCNLNHLEFFIRQPLYLNTVGHWVTIGNPDLWTTFSYAQQTGNIRDVEVSFEYYAPSYQGVCTQSLTNPTTGQYNIPMLFLLTNAESNLSMEGTFDDAYVQFNNEIVCDEWRVFNHTVKEFTNDFGSSFSGQSKTLGSLGFEAKNIYVRNIFVRGPAGTVEVW